MENTQDPQCSGGYRPPQFDIQFLMLATAALAVWLTLWTVTSVGSKFVLAVVLLTLLFGCGRTRRAVIFVVPGLFLPYLTLLLRFNRGMLNDSSYPAIAYLWQLPGILAATGQQRAADLGFIVLTVIATLFVFFAFVMLGRVSPLFSKIAGVLALLYSFLNCLICAAILDG